MNCIRVKDISSDGKTPICFHHRRGPLTSQGILSREGPHPPPPVPTPSVPPPQPPTGWGKPPQTPPGIATQNFNYLLHKSY